MRKLEVYDLNWREKEFVDRLRTNGFHYDSCSNLIQEISRDTEIPYLGRITREQERTHSNMLVIFNQSEMKPSSMNYPKAREAFSKLRKLAEEFE